MMRILKVLFVLGLLMAMLGAGAAGLAFWHFSRGLPDYQQLASYQPAVVTRVHAGDGRLLAEYATERRIFVPIGAMPPLVTRAFIAAEDKNFYSHHGVDFIAVARAGATNIVHRLLGQSRRPIGASTITQQVAKNFLLGNELSYDRKIREMLLAWRIEDVLPKDRILELYLNEIYLGSGAYGVAAAALQYFNKSLDELTVAEAAFLASLPKAPNNYNPQRFPEAAKARRDWVVDRMAEEGFVTADAAAAAKVGPVQTRRRDETELVRAPYFAEEVRRELLARYGEKGLYQSGLSVRTSLDPQLQAIADKALRDGFVNYDRKHGYRGPLTRIDIAGDAWRTRLAGLTPPPVPDDWRVAVVLATDGEGAEIGFADNERGRIPFAELKWAREPREDQTVGPPPKSAADVLKPGDVVLVQPTGGTGKDAKARKDAFTLRQIPEVAGALVAMDPHTGRVLAMVGGWSYEMSQFNRATQAKRQPGSSFKPFVYLTALDNGFTPSTLVLDAPFVIDQGPGLPKWKPTNYNTTKFAGPLPLRQGIEQSKNLMTARLAQVIGLDAVADTVERFGVMDKMPRQYSMVLGAGETTPLRMATAYAMLVNGGKRVTPTFIDRIQDRNGATIFRADNRPCEGCRDVEWTGQAPPEIPDQREQIEDPLSAYQIVSMLQGVVERGTGTAVKAVGKPLAGKTGTTNDYTDNWFVGFSPDLVAAIYIGFDAPRSLGEKETGGSNAAPIFRDFMTGALKDKPAVAFRIPPGIHLVRVNAMTGQPARPGDKHVIWEAFKPGTENAPGAVVSGYGVSDDEAPSGAYPEPATAGMPAQPVPDSGTGGLY